MKKIKRRKEVGGRGVSQAWSELRGRAFGEHVKEVKDRPSAGLQPPEPFVLSVCWTAGGMMINLGLEDSTY